MGPMCYPTTRSTRINPRLGVPVKHEAPTVRQFWIISVVLQSPEVETLENFFLTLVKVTSTKFSALALFLVVVMKMQPPFG